MRYPSWVHKRQIEAITDKACVSWSANWLPCVFPPVGNIGKVVSTFTDSCFKHI